MPACQRSHFGSLMASVMVSNTEHRGSRATFSDRVGQILRQWLPEADDKSNLFCWPSFGPVAYCLASGSIRCDVTAVLARNCFHEWVAPKQLPSALLKHLRTSPLCNGIPESLLQERAQSSDVVSWSGCCKKRFRPADVIAALRFSKNLKQPQFASGTAIASLRFFYPHDWQQRLQRLQRRTECLPKKSTLRDARVRLDLASMLYHRHWYKVSGPLFRYVSHDASSQRSMAFEAFLSAERLIRRESVRGKTFQQLQPGDFRHRLLPVSTLGHGFTDFRSKVHATMHGTFLDYGPSEASMRAANADVRQILSDMGVEFGLANGKDCIGQYFKMDSDVAATQNFMYPYALQVPGLLHILDGLIKEAMHCLPFWPKWQDDCKRIVQWVHGQKNRDKIIGVLNKDYPDRDDLVSLLKSMKTGVGRFAKWRWKTLKRAVRDMQRIETAVRLACSEAICAATAKDKVNAAAIVAASQNQFTWDAAGAIDFIIAPAMETVGWTQGCDCHEEELRQGKAIACVFKGCRARGLSQQIKSMKAELVRRRDTLRLGQFGSVDTDSIRTAITRIMASIETKLGWVDDIPYLVWQACSLQM